MKIAIFDNDIVIKNAISIDLKKIEFLNLIDTLKDCEVIITKDFSLRRDMLDILTTLKKVFIMKNSLARIDLEYLELLGIDYFYYSNYFDIKEILNLE